MGSRAGEEPMAGFSAYSIAKAGLAALVRTVALENKGTGVTANILAQHHRYPRESCGHASIGLF